MNIWGQLVTYLIHLDLRLWLDHSWPEYAANTVHTETARLSPDQEEAVSWTSEWSIPISWQQGGMVDTSHRRRLKPGSGRPVVFGVHTLMVSHLSGQLMLITPPHATTARRISDIYLQIWNHNWNICSDERQSVHADGGGRYSPGTWLMQSPSDDHKKSAETTPLSLSW